MTHKEQPSKKILLVGPAWLGDMVMTQSLFMLLKKQKPLCQIDVIAPKATLPILQRMPEVDATIEMPLVHGELGLKRRYLLGKSLRARNYTQAIVMPNSFKSALVPFFAKIPIRTGWRGEWRYGLLNDLRGLNKNKLPLMVERFLALALAPKAEIPKPFPVPSLAVDEENTKKTLAKFNLSPALQHILALCPGAAYGSAKQWPAEYFAEVAKVKIKENWQILLVGAKSDIETGEKIQKITENSCVNLIGKTTLCEAIDLLSLAHAVISNDSGMMHVAAALDRSVVAIYGSSSPDFTPPLSQKVEIVASNLPCSPCFKRECPLGHLQCMHEIKPEKILIALKVLLHK